MRSIADDPEPTATDDATYKFLSSATIAVPLYGTLAMVTIVALTGLTCHTYDPETKYTIPFGPTVMCENPERPVKIVDVAPVAIDVRRSAVPSPKQALPSE